MRTWLRFCLVALAAMVVWAYAPSVATAADDITNSDHDFSAEGAGDECTTCHVPHRALQSRLIWNHNFSVGALTWSDETNTLAGTTLPTNIPSWSGPTKFCLSCHDGTVGVGDTAANPYSWTGTASGKVEGGAVVAPLSDMKGNHPVALPYPDGTAGTYNGITSQAITADYQAAPSGVKLFNDPTGGANGIECATCHNPHDDTNPKFLRAAVTDFCVNCHIK